MSEALLQFLLSLGAVTAIVLLTHFLGFSRSAKLSDEAEAHDLLSLMPGGFQPREIALGEDGDGAIARDAKGRLAVLVPHGGQFVARPLDPLAELCAEGGVLTVTSPEIGRKPFSLYLGDRAQDWTVVRTDPR